MQNKWHSRQILPKQSVQVFFSGLDRIEDDKAKSGPDEYSGSPSLPQ